MLLSAIQIANPYPNEKIDVQFNQISPQLSNARFGVRFRYFYYDTWDSKINFRKTSDYNLVSNNTLGVKLSAISPTNFLNPNELAPFRWNVASDREYLYLTLLGGLSAITIWPSHPFPKITKDSNFQLTLDVGVISASAFNGEVQTPDFRKLVKNSNYATFDGTDSLIDTVSGYATLAGGKKGYEYSRNLNYYRTFNSSSLSPDIICNSLRIDIPVVTSTNIAVDQPDQIFILSFYNDTYSNENFNFLTNNSVTNLSCLESEVLTEMGITTPYTVQASMNDRTGGVLIELKAPLYIKPNSDITVWYETSASIAPGGVYFRKNSTNNFTLSVNQGVYPNTPVYLFNYNFVSPTKDLFTISFSPSSTITNQTISSTRIETVMVDNYYQNTYDMPAAGNIMFKRFIETSGDNTLVAFNQGNPLVTYSSEQWFAANNNQSITFKNDGKGNKHKVRIQLQSAAGAIFEEDRQLEFLLNKDKITFNLSLTESNDLYAVAEANIFPTPNSDYRVKWSANPPENIVFRDRNDNELLQNTFYPFHLYSKIYNLGVDKTEIILYSEEYDLSANTFWFPSSSVLGSAYLEIKGNPTDTNEVNTSQLSAFVNRNGYSYRVPAHANIIWNETANDSRGNLTLYSKDYSRVLKESTIYASSDNYSVINASFSTVPVESNPKQVLFNVSCNLFREDFNFNATKMFWIRQYPAKQYLFIEGKKSGDSVLYKSDAYSNVFYSSSGTISLSAIYSDLYVDYSNLQWNYSYSNGTTGTATGSSLDILLNSASACVSLTAFNATPIDGNFKQYNFTDTMCFYLASSIQPFDYIGIPGNIYVPIYQQDIGDRDGNTTSLSFNDLSYLNSLGMSAYKPCHTEYFSFSATPGFDQYKWQIGTKEFISNSNITTIPIQYSDVSSSNTVGVTAFNALFSPNNPATIYNSSSSDNSSVYKEHINFYDFPSPIASITVDNNYIDVTKYSEWATLQCELNTEFTTLENYNFNIVLSSADFVQSKNITGNTLQFQKLLKINIENADFIIKENSISYMKVYLVGNATINLPGYDYCAQTISLTSNFLDIAAYNGPNLYLYTSNNIVSAGEIVTFFNGSNQNFSSIPFSGFSYFVFDNGENSLQSGVSSYITTTYTSEGSKTPSLTGILPDGRMFVKQWENMIYVKNQFENYDSSITREIYDSISLPYSLADIRIKPNSWQVSETLNDCFQKFQTSFELLSSSCSINNVNFPKADAGFLGSLFGNFKWHTSYTADNATNTVFKNLKSAQIISNKLLVINNNSVEIYNISENPSLLYSFNRIGTGEVLENPVYLRYDSTNKRLFILDKSKMIFFVCEFDIDSPEDIKVTHYWGGTGERTDRTKLNNPTDFCIDGENRVFIVDKDSYIIKVYNKNLNWLKNIQLPNFSETNNPVYISETNDVFCVLTSDGTVTFFDYDEQILNSFTIPNCKNIVMNQIHYGILYALTNSSIIKYSINGTKITEKTLYSSPIDIAFDSESMYVLTPTYIHRFIDFIEVDRLLSASDNDGFKWSSIFVNHYEFVAAYIYNDSFTKIKDNFTLLNNRLEKKIVLDLDAYGDVISQYTSSVSPNPLSSLQILIGTNEPVLYDTINRSVENLYKNLVELKDNIDVQYNYPNRNNDIEWTWKYHYIDQNQRPSMDKNPISWIELTSERIINSTTLSSVSSWCSIRNPEIGGNHSQICWNYEYTQCNSYFPLTWEQLECGECKYPFTWEDLEKNCCITPDYIFEDCYSPCK